MRVLRNDVARIAPMSLEMHKSLVIKGRILRFMGRTARPNTKGAWISSAAWGTDGPEDVCKPDTGVRQEFHKPGFTLPELLVMIGIITMLASLPLGALSRAGKEGRSIVCGSNLRQLGMSLLPFLDDRDGVYPYSENIPAANGRGVSFWFDALMSTIPSSRWGEALFKCPAYTGISYPGEAAASSSGEVRAAYFPCGSCAYNASGRRLIVARPSGVARAGLGFSICDGEPIQRPLRERDVRAPADLCVFGDALAVRGPWGPGSRARLGGAANYDSLAVDIPVIEKVQHRVKFNMLFADTHAEGVKMNVLLSDDPTNRRRWNHDHRP
jgi:prepilin-type processing-associated H-X9-DG protein